MNKPLFGLIALVAISVLGFKLTADVQYSASMDDEEEEMIYCELDGSGIMNDCSGIPPGAPCGPDGFEGTCVEVDGLICDCIGEDGRRLEDVIDEIHEQIDEEEAAEAEEMDDDDGSEEEEESME